MFCPVLRGFLYFGVIALNWHAQPEDRPIDLSKYRQLFVDDYLIAETRHLHRVLHEAKRHPDNPLIISDRPWEGVDVYLYGTVLYDTQQKLFRMWYTAWPPYVVCYAVSKDGLHWEKPSLGARTHNRAIQNNMVRILRRTPHGEDNTYAVLHEPVATDPERRYKHLCYLGPSSYSWGAAFSADGFKWTMLPDATGPMGCTKVLYGAECCSVVYDEQSGRYLAFPKLYQFVPNSYHVQGLERRSVAVAFSDNFINWSQPKFILMPDARDDELATQRIVDARAVLSVDDGAEWYNAQFYYMAGFLYQGIYLGLLCVLDVSGGAQTKTFSVGGDDGPLQAELVSSRDLLHWQRVGDRNLIIPRGADDAWDGGIIYPSNRPVIVGDEIRIYYGGMAHTHGNPLYTDSGPVTKQARSETQTGIGLATLRLDGWVSMDAGQEEGSLTTKPLVFEGDKLIINSESPGGSVAVAVLDYAGKPISGFTRNDCEPFQGDVIRHTVKWQGNSDISALSGKSVRLRFHLRNAKLYSFAVQDD